MTEQPASEILVSVCYPTRGRIENLKRCIDSVLSTVTKPERIEHVLRVDNDDQETLDALKEIVPSIHTRGSTIKVLSGPRIPGDFARAFAAMFTECCNRAKGRWIFQLSSDCGVMPESKGWDDDLAQVVQEKVLVSPGANLYRGQRYTWKLENHAWHTAHFLIMENHWWRKFGLADCPYPVDTMTLNLLTGAGWRGVRHHAWTLHILDRLVTFHNQVEDQQFKERGRLGFD